MLRLRQSWTEEAQRLLSQRDRFTQKAITDDFSATVEESDEPASTSIEFDPHKKGYVTPVVDDRYGVVWYLRNDDTAEVHAIVPTTRFNAAMSDLKERVKTVVARESDGKIVLEE